jgi:fibronectin type 3 domain-containing protein
LIGNSIFFYRITTITDLGESNFSSFVGATVQIDTRAPAQPTALNGEAPLDDLERLDLTWKAPITDVDGALLTGISSYLVYRAASSTGPFELVGTSTNNAFSDTGLVAQTTYYYQVEATDQEGNFSARSTTFSLATSGVGIPQNVRGSASSPSSLTQPAEVVLRWDASLGTILLYEVQRTTVEGSTDDSDFINITPNNDNTTRTDKAAVRNTVYYYRIRAQDVEQRLSEWSELVEIIVLP